MPFISACPERSIMGFFKKRTKQLKDIGSANGSANAAAADDMLNTMRTLRGSDTPKRNAVIIDSSDITPMKAESNAGGGGTAGIGHSSSGSSETPANGIDDYYNKLISTLRGYGISLSLPSLDELREQLEAFLRPAVDSAIEQRQRYGEQAMAELDADAYSRGMGGSSYLSSMKEREHNDIASDIAALESSYGAEIAKYMYDASMELMRIRSEFEKMEYQSRLDRENALFNAKLQNSGRTQGSSRSSGKSQEGDSETETGAYREDFTSDDYESYRLYLEICEDDERQNLFHGTSTYWKQRRAAMQAALSNNEYNHLMRLYGQSGSTGGGSHVGGEAGWVHVHS